MGGRRRALGALVCVAITSAAPCRAAFLAELVPATISDAARNDPSAGVSLADAQSWHLKLTADEPVLFVDLHLFALAGSIFHHPIGSSTPPTLPRYGTADPVLVGLFPSLDADTYVTLAPQSVGAVDKDNWIPTAPGDEHVHYYRYAQNPILNDFTTAQITMLPDGGQIELRIFANVYLRGPENTILRRNFYYPSDFSGSLTADGNLDFRVDESDLDLLKQQLGAIADDSFPRPSDVDLDGDVDFYDGSIVLNYFGQPGTRAEGDVNGDGIVNINDFKASFQFNHGQKWNRADFDEDLDVDGNDFLIWQRELGNGFADPPEPAPGNVPEPTGAALLACVALLGRGLVRTARLPRV